LFAGQTERVLNQPTATVLAKPRDMHHCGWHDITRPASPRARCTWRENVAMTVAIQQRLDKTSHTVKTSEMWFHRLEFAVKWES